MSRTPRLVFGLAIAGAVFFALPLLGLLTRVPWSEVPSLLRSEIVLDALVVSVIASVGATGVSLLVGVPLAWVLARHRFTGRSLVRGVVLMPLVLPPVVAGVALLLAFGRRGLAGGVLESTGLVLPFSIWGVIVAAAFVAMPFLVITVEAALRSLDPATEQAALTLGAGPWRVLRRVIFPAIGPAIAAGALLAWARALGEFGATLTFAGSLPGRTQTMPLAVFVALEQDRDAAIAISLVLVAVALGVLVAMRHRLGGRR